MALRVADRVKESTTTTGTGSVALGGAPSGYRTFSAGVGANNTTYYCIADQTGSNWEVGLGTLDGTAANLARTTVYASSNAGSLVSFTAGTKDVFCDFPAWAYPNGNGMVMNANTVATSITIPVGQNGLSAGPVTVNSGITVTVSSGSTWKVV